MQSCRDENTDRIIALLNEFGPMEVSDICKKLNRGTKYIRSLIDESEDRLHFTLQPKLVREWVVWSDSCHQPSTFLDQDNNASF